MRQFKVIALSCSGKGKNIYNSGDVVQESGFPEGTADELVEKGFIKEIESEPINDEAEPESEPDAEPESEPDAEPEAEPEAEPNAEPEAEDPSKTGKKADKKKK